MAEKQQVVLGLDLGGTKLLAAVVDRTGHVLDKEKIRTATTNEDDIVTQIISIVETLRTRHAGKGTDILAVGIGVPGVVDAEGSRIIATANLPMDDVDLGRRISEACGLPIIVGNDVTLATMGEAWYGAGRGAANLLGVFVGTGIGGGLVVDSKIYNGAHGAAGEIGHLLVDRDGSICGCGRRGCLEALASRSAIVRDLIAEVENGRMSVLGDRIRSGRPIRSNRLRKALDEGDMLVTEVVNRASTILGQTIGGVANLLDPDTIVIGGGLIEACDIHMLPLIKATAEDRMMPVAGAPVNIVKSDLGDDAGVMGAAALAFEAVATKRPSGPTMYVPIIEWLGESEVSVNGKRYTNDFIVRTDGSVHGRRKRLSRHEIGTHHGLGISEIKNVCKGRPHLLIVGEGSGGSFRIAADARSWLEEHGIRLAVYPTRDAVSEYRSSRGPRALMLHLKE
jgi:glucokinase